MNGGIGTAPPKSSGNDKCTDTCRRLPIKRHALRVPSSAPVASTLLTRLPIIGGGVALWSPNMIVVEQIVDDKAVKVAIKGKRPRALTDFDVYSDYPDGTGRFNDTIGHGY